MKGTENPLTSFKQKPKWPKEDKACRSEDTKYHLCRIKKSRGGMNNETFCVQLYCAWGSHRENFN